VRLAREKQIPHYARDDNLRGGLLVGVAEIEERDPSSSRNGGRASVEMTTKTEA
jgi:hypothetical protein